VKGFTVACPARDDPLIRYTPVRSVRGQSTDILATGTAPGPSPARAAKYRRRHVERPPVAALWVPLPGLGLRGKRGVGRVPKAAPGAMGTAIVGSRLLMVKNPEQYPGTGGWGLAQWLGRTQTPCGKDLGFAWACYTAELDAWPRLGYGQYRRDPFHRIGTRSWIRSPPA